MRYLPSGTAEGLAYLRYRETLRPPEEMICNDYLAYHFSAWWTRMAAIMMQPLPNSMVEWTLEQQGRGVVGFIAARTRMFDDFVEQQIGDGIKQFVILGAGLDSRAYRFAKQLRGIKTFEVDHPLTQIEKKARVAAVFKGLPFQIHYVPVDLMRDDLIQALLKAGYDPTQRTLFTMEGVAMYLDETTVRRILTSVHACSGHGSSLIFDYVYLAAIDGRILGHAIKHMNYLQYWFDEPVLSGIEAGEAEAYVQSCGFDQIEEFTPQRLYDIYFKSVVPQRPMSDLFAVIIARNRK